MAEHRVPNVEHIENPEVHHEESDINIRGVLGFAAALFVAAVIVHLVVGALYVFLRGTNEVRYPREYPLADTSSTAAAPVTRFPMPRLQEKPREDLKALRAEEDQVLRGYAWVDRGRGVVRIPIDRAMEAVVKQGLPARPQQAPGTAPAGLPQRSSSGRTYEPPR